MDQSSNDLGTEADVSQRELDQRATSQQEVSRKNARTSPSESEAIR